LPDEKKYICVATPHTSNWDGVLLVVLAQSVGLAFSWMAKETLLHGPQRHILLRFGAVPIDRRRSHNVVAQTIEEFRRREELRLVIAPEGTRAATPYWKSGFYHIALGAGVPVVPGFMDYARKRARLGPPLHLTGDVHADMDRIRAFYADHEYRARFPQKVGPIRLREEDEDERR